MTQSKFLFITALTPEEYRSTKRDQLFQNYIKALAMQTYPYWQALLLGELEKTDGNIIYVNSKSITKGDKLKFAYEYVANMSNKPEFLIRLDDDDLISPYILERIHDQEFDCYADKYHLFYDSQTGMTSRQKRPWLANTVIHKTKHALAHSIEGGAPLFTKDHSKTWHTYYKEKKIKWATQFHPIYMRVLSPTSITAKEVSEEKENSAYRKYLSGFGKWRKTIPRDFRNLVSKKS